MAPTTRRFNLRIWGLALGYFSFYAPYSALIKVVTLGLWPGVGGQVSGFQLLPATAISTAVAVPAIISGLGWWKYASRRPFLGVGILFPSPLVLLSGLGTAMIIATTTLAYASAGVSILLTLLLLRGGVLIIAPTIDFLFARRVRWFSWLALAFALTGVLVALADVNHYQMTLVAALNIVAYLTGYVLRLPCINALAKCDDERVTCRFLVEEQMVAMILLVAIPAFAAVIGSGSIAMDIRSGFTGFFTSRITLPGILVGTLYACLYVFGTLIYLDRRENTFCIPLNRGASVLSGIVATYALAYLFEQAQPSAAEIGSSGLMIVALLVLSPLHHVQRYAGRVPRSLRDGYRTWLNVVARAGRRRPAAVPLAHAAMQPDSHLVKDRISDDRRRTNTRRVAFLFVCGGNTCRSPMAEAIGNAEIAVRFQIPVEAVRRAPVQALSAGVSARVGAPMTSESRQALGSLGIPAIPHSARNVTVELVDQVERIFCMTKAHRRAVIDLVPAAAAKTQCLDPDGDVDDPIGRGLAAYISCARRIHSLVLLRFDESLATLDR